MHEWTDQSISKYLNLFPFLVVSDVSQSSQIGPHKEVAWASTKIQ